MGYSNKNSFIQTEALPFDIVFHPSWWNKHVGITFDKDFYYHALKRIEVEKRMEHELYERFGQYGVGEDRGKDLPVIGAVHNASGYLLSEMLGCKVIYQEDGAPQVIPAGQDKLNINIGDAFKSPAFRSLLELQDKLKTKYGFITGDINWGGILNIALDLVGEKIFLDFYNEPQSTKRQFSKIGDVIEKFVTGITKETGTSSISVNRNVRHFQIPVFLHSECSHTMISTEQYEEFLLPIDLKWSEKHRPFGIHYCGSDPHRYAETFSKIKNLDFLDVGWGGDVKMLRKHLPQTFFNLRLSPVEIIRQGTNEIRETIVKLVKDSGNPNLTGLCCINMDDSVTDEKINIIFETVNDLKKGKL